MKFQKLPKDGNCRWSQRRQCLNRIQQRRQLKQRSLFTVALIHLPNNKSHQLTGSPTISWVLATFLLLLSISKITVEAAESLSGALESCSNEGEEVQITGISNAKCFKCACQNGFVNCNKESCPSIDDCYLLDAKAADTCCQKCKGCIYEGIAYASGAEWTDPANPCRTFKCVASVVTETVMNCFTQCDDNQLTPPRPGECCSTCQGCKFNGQVIPEGQEVVGSIDDRCLVCQCSGNRLSCAKKTCPILTCPISKQKQHPNECCPRCTEHRDLLLMADKCFFNNKVHLDRKQFMPDRCTNCTCTNGTSVCQRNTCPILECSPEYQEIDGCCPRCISSEVRSECIYSGITYQNNETWNLGPCRSCRCTAGNIRCSEMRCPTVKCKANEEMKVLEGQCCPECIETAGTCTVFGDPHFKTFDGKFYSFQGSCKYLLTGDCVDHSFSIRLTNDGRGTRHSSWTKTVTLKMKGLRVNLGQKLRVKVNGSRISMPYSNGSILSIQRHPEGIVMKTELGINIEWDGNNFLQVLVPASYKRKLCGLCGNYNGIARDDLMCRNGTIHQEVGRFAHSWKVGGAKACSRRTENITAAPNCRQKRANSYCRPLREVFGDCDNRLNPNNYIESCKMDVCECPTGMCQCDSFAAYAHECKRLGVELPNWREATNCPVGMWRHNTTLALANSLRFPSQHADSISAHARRQHRRRKQKHQQHQDKMQQLHHNQLLQRDYMAKHIPKSLLVSKSPDRTPPPLH